MAIPPAKRAIVNGMDGAAMELVKNLIEWGDMPHLAKLARQGAWKPMIGVFPTLTPPGWTATSTGSWPGTHGIMEFNIRKLGGQLDETVWASATGLTGGWTALPLTEKRWQVMCG
jgi:predicted AlkP superfamily phosphohydrolase/phosphomutase